MSSSPKAATTSVSIAHVTCSKGVCDVALLAACLDAATDSVRDVYDAEKLMKTYQAAVVDGLSQVDASGVAPIMSIQLKKASHGLSVLEDDEPPTPSLPFHSFVPHAKIIKMMKRVAAEDLKWHMLPEWVADLSRKVSMELNAAWERVYSCEQRPRNECDSASDATAYSTAVLHFFNVIGCLLCLESMEVQEVFCSPIPISVANDEPLIQELLRGMVVDTTTIPTSMGNKPTSSVSPLSAAVGVALLRVLTGVDKNFSQRPTPIPMILRRTGSGSDAKNNVKMTVFIGDSSSTPATSNPIVNRMHVDESPRQSAGHTSNSLLLWDMDTVTKMEANLDDITGETLACIIELLMNHGAIDAWVSPIVMKKGRPAHTLHCLCKDTNNSDNDTTTTTTTTTVDKLLELIFRHSTTLGIRIYRGIPRAKLDRSTMTVDFRGNNHAVTTTSGQVNVKISKFKNGEIVSTKAEYEDCKRIMEQTGVPLKTVAHQALLTAAERLQQNEETG